MMINIQMNCEEKAPDKPGDGGGTGTITMEETVTRTMPMYKVIMHDDDKTSMDFVIMALQQFFKKEFQAAMTLMMEIHKSGSGLVGVYALEHAELKVQQTHSAARAQKYPLTCSIEPA